MKHALAILILSPFLLMACVPSSTPSTAPVIVTGAGDITSTIERYRQLLGGVNNGGEPGSRSGGFRELNWDSIPDDLAAPNFYPSDFFNAPTAPRARGAVLSTPGTGLMVSADGDNFDGTLPRFGNIKNESPSAVFRAIEVAQSSEKQFCGQHNETVITCSRC